MGNYSALCPLFFGPLADLYKPGLAPSVLDKILKVCSKLPFSMVALQKLFSSGWIPQRTLLGNQTAVKLF